MENHLNMVQQGCNIPSSSSASDGFGLSMSLPAQFIMSQHGSKDSTSSPVMASSFQANPHLGSDGNANFEHQGGHMKGAHFRSLMDPNSSDVGSSMGSFQGTTNPIMHGSTANTTPGNTNGTGFATMSPHHLLMFQQQQRQQLSRLQQAQQTQQNQNQSLNAFRGFAGRRISNQQSSNMTDPNAMNEDVHPSQYHNPPNSSPKRLQGFFPSSSLTPETQSEPPETQQYMMVSSSNPGSLVKLETSNCTCFMVSCWLFGQYALLV
jgi:hypothetical protein